MRYELEDVAFGACNTLPRAGHTRLEIKLLDPQRDRKQLEAMLTSRPDYLQELAYRNLTFCREGEVTLAVAQGPQRGMVKEWDKILEQPLENRVPIDVMGQVDRVTTAEVLGKEQVFKPYAEPLRVDLQPGEVQQYFVRIEPKDRQLKAAFVLHVEHWLDWEKQEYIGGLCYFLVSPYNPFRAERPRSEPPLPRKTK